MFGFKKKNIKLLDSSVIIDGRIKAIIETGFLEGNLCVPSFIISELQSLSDSKDNEKRRKGRRGLELLESLKKMVPLDIIDKYSDEVQKAEEVDIKLMMLSKELGAKLLTLDYNLNKVCKVNNVSVLDINELFEAVRPIVTLGQKLSVRIARRGDQAHQGVGSLEDGAMVIVDGAGDMVGKKIKIEVRQFLQTQSGRLIFAKYIKENEEQ
jgi:uncharacterized protein YacL